MNPFEMAVETVGRRLYLLGVEPTEAAGEDTAREILPELFQKLLEPEVLEAWTRLVWGDMSAEMDLDTVTRYLTALLDERSEDG